MTGFLKRNIPAIIVALAVVALTFAVIVTYPSRQKEYKIIYIIKTTDKLAFWNTLRMGMETAAKETGANVEIRGVELENDVEGQNALIEQAVSEKPDAIILSASDYFAQDVLCKSIVDAGITLVTVDSDINSDVKQCFVGTNSYLAGFRAGEALSALVPEDAKIALIGSVEISQTGMDRVNGFKDALTEKQRARLIGPYFSGSVVETAYEIAVDILGANPDLDGIASMNEPSFTGTVLALKDMNLENPPSVTGIDSSIHTIQAMEEGLVDAIIVQNPFNMGYLAVITTVDILNGKKAPEYVDTGEYVITKQNMYEPENQKLLFIFSEELR